MADQFGDSPAKSSDPSLANNHGDGESVALSQHVQTLSAPSASERNAEVSGAQTSGAGTATAVANEATGATNPNSAPASGWERFKDTTEQGLKDIPAGMLKTLKDPVDLIENAAISFGLGAAAKVILPETGVLGKVATLGFGLYMGAEAGIPIFKAYSAGMHATSMNDISHAGSQLGDAVGGLAVNLPLGYGFYKGGELAGDSLLQKPGVQSFNEWAGTKLNPLNDSLTARWNSGANSIKSLFNIKPFSPESTTAATRADTAPRQPSEAAMPQERGVEAQEQTKAAPVDPALELPTKYQPTSETFGSTKVTGISRAFLENLKKDDTGTYYGAGLRYPDIMADPELAKYINAHNQLTLSRIDPQVYADQLAMEAKAGGAFGSLPKGWSEGTDAHPLTAIDATNGDEGSMTVGDDTYQLTSKGAPNRQLVLNDASAPGGMKTVIPQSPDFEMQQAIHVDANGVGKFAVVGSHDGASILNIYGEDGGLQKQISLPGYGTLHDVKAGPNPSQLQFLYDTPIAPPQALTVDLADNSANFSSLPGYEFDSDKFQSDKLMVPYEDADGKTQTAPVYLSYPKGMPMDGNNVAQLEIYGGFDVGPQYLRYMANSAAVMQRGGIAVSPVLPGDGGLGFNNFQEGLGKNIINNKLALTAIIQKLHDLGYSSPETTGLYGRSNGGMEVNMFLNTAPHMVGAAVSESGVDSIFDSPKINPDTGRYWEDEFGNPASRTDEPWMRQLDVNSNVSANIVYPPTLAEIGTIDGVVNPGNGITYAHLRQALANNGEALLYSRIGEGHDPTTLALQSAFLWDRLSQNAKARAAAAPASGTSA